MQPPQSINLSIFPFGVYILTDTLLIPPGSRLVGEAFTQLAAKGTNFADAGSPRAMIKVGNPGDTGIALFQVINILSTNASFLTLRTQALLR